jgi:hypothetical protein
MSSGDGTIMLDSGMMAEIVVGAERWASGAPPVGCAASMEKGRLGEGKRRLSGGAEFEQK